MTTEGTMRRNRDTVVYTATAAMSPGQVVQVPDGRAGIVEGLQAIAIGDEVSVRTSGQVDVVCATATTYSAGDTVGFDDTTNLAVAGGAGDFDIGQALFAKASGPTVVRVDLNAQ